MPKHVKDSSWRECFHAAAMTSGGERSRISAAVSLSMTIIGRHTWGSAKDRWTHWWRRRLVGLRLPSRASESKAARCGASAVGQEAEVSDAHETLRQQMQQEAAQELIDS